MGYLCAVEMGSSCRFMFSHRLFLFLKWMVSQAWIIGIKY